MPRARRGRRPSRAFDRLVAADPKEPEAWLRTPGLLRLATALLHQNRPSVAAMLLQGGAKRRTQDGLPPVDDKVGVGVAYSIADGTVRVTELLHPERRKDESGKIDSSLILYPSSLVKPGDVIVKVNDTELTRESLDKLDQLLAGEAGTKVRLTVRHSGSEKPEVIELTRERFVNDPATGELLYPLRAAVNERLAKEPRDAGLLELRAELAGQWSDAKAQVADYTAAIESLAQQKPEAAAVDLKRLYGRRGNAYVALRQWQQAIDDYARVITDATTDEALLSNQALALAESLLLPDVPGVDTLVSTSENERMKWRFTTEKPADEWAQPDFNDSKWQVGMGPFGTADVEWAHTAWLTPDIWLRRSFEFPNAKNVESLFLRVNCDDDAQVFLNGTPVARRAIMDRPTIRNYRTRAPRSGSDRTGQEHRGGPLQKYGPPGVGLCRRRTVCGDGGFPRFDETTIGGPPDQRSPDKIGSGVSDSRRPAGH